jgi:hypothetical protein
MIGMGKRVGRRYRRVHKQKAQREQERNLAHGANETKLEETDVIHVALLGRGESVPAPVHRTLVR